MWKELYDVTVYRCVTLSCDTGCQSCKRALNTAQIFQWFQWHAIKYSISNRIRRWSSIEIYKISGVSHVLNFCLGKIKILAKIEIKMLRFRKKQVRKWSTRCCFVTFEISSSEINVTKSHYFITNYIFTGFLKNCEKRKNVDVNQNTQDCHW